MLDILGMPGHTHLEWCIDLRKTTMFMSRQKINFILHVFLEILQQRYFKLFLFCTLDLSCSAHPKWYYHLVENVFVYLQAKNQLHPPMLLWRYCKDMQSCFGYFGHAWLHLSKLIVSPHIKLRCLCVCKIIKFIIHFFLTILHVQESCNLIGCQHFGPQLETQNVARYVGEISIAILVLILDYFQEKLTWQNFSKNKKKKLFGDHSGPLLPKIGQKLIFLKKRTLSFFQ